jgi:hypothetical protein
MLEKFGTPEFLKILRTMEKHATIPSFSSLKSVIDVIKPMTNEL